MHTQAHAVCWHRYSLNLTFDLKSTNINSFTLSDTHRVHRKYAFKCKKSKKRGNNHTLNRPFCHNNRNCFKHFKESSVLQSTTTLCTSSLFCKWRSEYQPDLYTKIHFQKTPHKHTHTHTHLLCTYAAHEASCGNDFLSANYPHTARSLFHFTGLILYVIEFIPNENKLKLLPLLRFHPTVFRVFTLLFHCCCVWKKLVTLFVFVLELKVPR